MRKIFVIAALLSGYSALASGPSVGLSIRNFVVDGKGNATLTIRMDNANIPLIGQMGPSTTLASSDGRILADCSAIGEKKGELCLIHRDGGNGALALFKSAPNGFTLANGNLALANEGDTLGELVSIVDSRSRTSDEAMASLNSAIGNSSTVAQVIDAVQGRSSTPVQLADAGRGPLPPPLVAPPPVEADAAGDQGEHTRHEEEHDYIERHDKVIDTYDSQIHIPVTEQYEYQQGCIDGVCQQSGVPIPQPPIQPPPPMDDCGACGLPPGADAGPVPVPVPVPPPLDEGYGYGYGYPVYPYAPVVVAPPPVMEFYRRGVPVAGRPMFLRRR